jgi:hypothetical protein
LLPIRTADSSSCSLDAAGKTVCAGPLYGWIPHRTAKKRLALAALTPLVAIKVKGPFAVRRFVEIGVHWLKG